MAQPKTINGWLSSEQQHYLEARGFSATYKGLVKYIQSLDENFPERKPRPENKVNPTAREIIKQGMLDSTIEQIKIKFNLGSLSTAKKALDLARAMPEKVKLSILTE